MAQTEQAIQDASRRNGELLSTLAATDYAPIALDQQTRYIGDLHHQIAETDKDIKQLTTKRETELKEHEKYQSSIMKRFAYRVGGKREVFEDKASKEEREYFAALEEELKAKRLRESLEDQLAEAETAKTNLEPIAQQNADAQNELDDLYNRIFSGPTPSFPEEDAAEAQVSKANDAYRDAQSTHDAEVQTLKILTKALGVMRSIMSNLADAHSASNWDLWGGGLMSDMMERNSLSEAQVGVAQLKSLLNEAARTSPHIQGIGDMNVAQFSIVSDVIFDNIFTDLAFHDKIKDSEAQMATSQRRLQEQEKLARDRLSDLRGQVSSAEADLEAARKELQNVRSEAFNRVASQ